ncbi:MULTISPECIES: agmatine/peptidylarginine deiminase [unclassified Streptomyces]|uniref:agmatine deiminase family protein n=1 Tax=unclassified Streptomyces TaxID=2593676 RepID=UPI00381B5FE1
MSGFLHARRTVLRTMAAAGAVALGAAACSPKDVAAGPDDPSSAPSGNPSGEASGRRLGAEWESHARTFMSWPASQDIWGEHLAPVRQDIAGIARAVGAHEPVIMLARPDQVDAAQKAVGADVEVVPISVNDLWARDTVPVFVEEGKQVRGVDFNFSGWGGKQQHTADAKVGRAVLSKYGIPRDQTWIVAEGGSFETDGEGTLMVTESSVVNKNRNPGKSRQQIEDELKRVLGVQKVIWFDGVRGEDITDAHVDSLARFVAPGVVLLDQAFPGEPANSWSRSADQAKKVLKDATDARGKKLQVIELPQPDPNAITGRDPKMVTTYANFYVANQSVFLPKFGDAKADDRARQMLRDHFPGREVVSLKIDTIASGGGGIHCSTHDEPGKPAS